MFSILFFKAMTLTTQTVQQKELLSANEELSQLKDQINLEALENASYEKSKEEAFTVYDQLLKMFVTSFF